MSPGFSFLHRILIEVCEISSVNLEIVCSPSGARSEQRLKDDNQLTACTCASCPDFEEEFTGPTGLTADVDCYCGSPTNSNCDGLSSTFDSECCPCAP